MLSMRKMGTSAVYGAVDIATEYLDSSVLKTSGKPFETATDIQRTVATVGGLALSHFGRGNMAEYGADIAQASIPLFEKTLVNAVLSFTGSTTRFMPRGVPRGQVLIRRPGSATQAAGRIPGIVY